MICFYHSADLDGHCSGAIVKWKYPDCEMIGIDYGHEVPWEKVKNQDVIIVDFCLQPFEGKMPQLLKECRTLLWIDHHKTEIAAYRKWAETNVIPEAKFKVVLCDDHYTEAGCELAWKFFYPLDKDTCESYNESRILSIGGGIYYQNNKIPLGVWLLGRYDIWDLEADERIMPFQWGMRLEKNTYPENKELWKKILWGNKYDINPIIQNGELILQFRDAQNTKIMSATAFETDFEGFKFIASNNPLSNSQTFDSIYDPKKYDGMISFYWKPKSNAFTVSLYTTKNIDMAQIAKKHGGGGHKKACGFQCKELPFKLNRG